MSDKTIPYSLLDLAPIPEGSSAREAFSHSLDLARLAEKRGYHRYWLAEHRNMPGIASAIWRRTPPRCIWVPAA